MAETKKKKIIAAIALSSILSAGMNTAAPLAWAAQPSTTSDLGPYFKLLFGANPSSQGPIQSHLAFDLNSDPAHANFTVQLADITAPDPLKACPINDQSAALDSLADSLVQSVRNSVMEIQNATPECQAIIQHLNNSQKLLGGLINSQLNPDLPTSNADTSTTTVTTTTGATGAVTAVASTKTDTDTTTSTTNPQDMVNDTIRQQAAVNEIVSTAGDLLQSNCLPTADDQQKMQQIAGQALAVAGLLVGGWAGVVTGIAGQLLGSNVFGEDNSQKALDSVREYEKAQGQGTFLCGYREMQKTSCLLLTSPAESTIGGIDTSFGSGATKLTLDTATTQTGKDPIGHQEVRFLYKVSLAHNDGRDSSIDGISGFCRDSVDNDDPNDNGDWKYFKPVKNKMFLAKNGHPKGIRPLFLDTVGVCEQLQGYKTRSGKADAALVAKVNGEFDTLVQYYSDSKQHKTKLGQYALTWESLKFFDAFKNNVTQARNQGGNQFRVNFLDLVNKLDGSMAQQSFNSLFNEDVNKLDQAPASAPDEKRRYLAALLDLCETFDPTLACLYPDGQTGALQRAWKDSCAGPQSKICKNTYTDILTGSDSGETVNGKLFGGYVEYYKSLCNL